MKLMQLIEITLDRKASIKINTIVNRNLKTLTGGQKFFTQMDKEVQLPVFFEALWERAKKEQGDFTPAVSGGYGLEFARYLRVHQKVKAVTFNGSLRSKEPISLANNRHLIQDKKVVFFDDTFYQGKTRNKVSQEIERLGGKLVATYVCYDGSKITDPSVHSLYRYHKIK
jgi:hypothetical protein